MPPTPVASAPASSEVREGSAHQLTCYIRATSAPAGVGMLLRVPSVPGDGIAGQAPVVRFSPPGAGRRRRSQGLGSAVICA